MKTAYEILKEAEKMSKEVIAAEADGKVIGLSEEVADGAEVKPLTFADKEGKKVFWHTASHILAQAVKRLYPEAKLTIGPSVDNGFYYDIDTETAFAPEILTKIEAEMKKIVKENLTVERFLLPRGEAKKLMEERNEPYKVLLIDRIPEGEDISFYRQGEFVDLCAGPHLHSTGAVKAFKLTQCTGAYWEGNSKNKVLQRVYGVAFPTKDELNSFLTAQEEARKRDHNKLGRELEWVEDEEQKRGYLLTKTPLMAKSDLYKISGHWDHYLDGMFVLGDPKDETKECFALRPMTCPFQYQVYLNKARSYRDLPMRLGETSTLFRNEDSGEMHGLIRVRQFTISEGHIMLRPEQLEDEFRGCLELAKYFLDTVGMLEDCTFRFSQWDPENREKYIGTPEQWDEAQGIMKKILDDLGVEYTVGVGEAAFYGPKLDVQYKNVFGKEDTIVTIQVDQLLAEQFGMYYTDTDGHKKRPYILHRTSLGCYERTLAYLIEKYAGALPTWLSPTQVKLLPIGNEQLEYTKKIAEKMQSFGIRVETDDRYEKIGYKIRQAQLQKIPYMLIIGDKEMADGTVSVRSRKNGDMGAVPADEFIDRLVLEIAKKER